MNIAFDAKRITRNKTGLGNYSRFIINTLAEYYPENNYLLASYSKGDSRLYEHLLNNRCVNMLYPEKPWTHFGDSLWRNLGIRSQLKKWDVDIFHGLSNEMPLYLQTLSHRRMATIVTIHDLIFLHHPEYYKLIDRNLYRLKYLKSAKQCDHVIAVSKKTKEDLIEFVGIPDEKISVIYQGCALTFSHIPTLKADWVRKKYNLPDRFLLFVGSIEERKNLELVIKSLPIIEDKEISLIAVGKKTPYADKIMNTAHRLGVSDRVRMLHDINNDELMGLYKLASLFVYPSKYEGFGIPIIEAVSASVPVIAATGSSMEEAGGPHCLYTDPNDHEMLSDMINSVLSDSQKRNEMIKQSLSYVRRFSPKHISDKLNEVYSKVMLR